jgi:S1-C subfamily serine protease
VLRNLLIATTMFCASVATADDRGFFGFALRTEFDGSFWSPVLSVASIAQVVPNSPTAKSGLAVGDVLLELEGIVVPGAKGDELKKLKAVLNKDDRIGDQLHMKLRRANGEIYSAVLVAEPRKE